LPFALKITHISYESFTTIIEEISDSIKVILKLKTILNETATVQSRNHKSKRLGVREGIISGNFHLQPNTALVVKIDATEYANAKLKAIHFNLTQDKYEDVSAPFKVLVFNHDSICNCPGKKRIEDYVVSGAKKRKWFTVDVGKDNIILDNEIIYVGLLTMPHAFYKERTLVKRGKNDIYPSFEYKLPALRMLSKKSNSNAAFWKMNYDKQVSKWFPDTFLFLIDATITY
jgi:hypothetical protein